MEAWPAGRGDWIHLHIVSVYKHSLRPQPVSGSLKTDEKEDTCAQKLNNRK